MTDKQAIYIKTFLEGAFPILKETKESDLVYVVMLKEYDFETMFQATKNYIKKSCYAPTIAGLIQEYDLLMAERKKLLTNKLLEIVADMEKAGAFKPNEDYRKLSEYEKAVLAIEDNNLSDKLKSKILAFVKNDKNIKSMLDELSGKEKECSSLFLNAGIVDE